MQSTGGSGKDEGRKLTEEELERRVSAIAKEGVRQYKMTTEEQDWATRCAKIAAEKFAIYGGTALWLTGVVSKRRARMLCPPARADRRLRATASRRLLNVGGIRRALLMTGFTVSAGGYGALSARMQYLDELYKLSPQSPLRKSFQRMYARAPLRSFSAGAHTVFRRVAERNPALMAAIRAEKEQEKKALEAAASSVGLPSDKKS